MSLARILLILLAVLPIASAEEKTLPTYPHSEAVKLVVVESMLIDPNDGETPAKPGPTGKTAATSRTTRTGKVMERSRWFVPETLVNLILRCVGNR